MIRLRNLMFEKSKNLKDDKSPYKPCRKCIQKYSGLMGDDCAYQAIERFEETYGTASGGSMGDNYFEGNWRTFDQLIVGRINKLIGNAWTSMNSKFRMQLWSFMYNSDSSSNDKYRWLAVLYMTAHPKVTEYNARIAREIIDKRNPRYWAHAVKTVSNYSGWNEKLGKFIRMLDAQYQTYGNKGAYQNSWGKRPRVLNAMYDECKRKK